MSSVASMSNAYRAERQPLPSVKTRGRVVMVDDEPGILATWGMILSKAGYEVTCCADGLEALEAIAEGCDCVITDYRMPGMTGVELMRAARPLSQAKFILMTANVADAVTREAREAGAYCVIHKPTWPPAVLQELKSIV